VLESSLLEARKRREETFSNLSASYVLKSIKSQYGIDLARRSFDRDDVVGLVGEILIEELLRSPQVKNVIAKWRTTGTSKSGGIDLVCRVASDHAADVLLLCESKHVHSEARHNGMPLVLADRIRRGLDEFQKEKVLLNLTNIILRIDRSVGTDLSIAMSPDAKRMLMSFIRSHLVDENYDLLVAVFADDQFFDSKLAQDTTKRIHEPMSLGVHTVSLAVVTSENLESETKRLCLGLAGS
jgi:hypothetical protein